jgi:transcriptional regulator with XRE-family HTH domain
MTHLEFRDALKKLNISRERFAIIIGVHDRTIRRYFNGEGEVPLSIKYMLTGWIKLKELGHMPVIQCKDDVYCPSCKLYYAYVTQDDKAAYSYHLKMHLEKGELKYDL